MSNRCIFFININIQNLAAFTSASMAFTGLWNKKKVTQGFIGIISNRIIVLGPFQYNDTGSIILEQNMQVLLSVSNQLILPQPSHATMPAMLFILDNNMVAMTTDRILFFLELTSQLVFFCQIMLSQNNTKYQKRDLLLIFKNIYLFSTNYKYIYIWGKIGPSRLYITYKFPNITAPYL